jgi:dolichyl-phosphate beta-glucosyltransferase
VSLRVLVVIPAYKEAGRLPALLRDVKAYLSSASHAQAPFDVQFSIVDDGSPQADFEATEHLLVEQGLRDRVDLVRLEHNRGKGGAIRAGFERGLAAGFDYLGFVDADSAVSIGELHRVLVYLTSLRSTAPLAGAIGSRVKMLGRHVERSMLRHYMGRVFATFVGVYFRHPVYATQCGLKVFEREALTRYLDVPSDERWVWDTQLLLAMLHAGEPIHEVPVDWRETGQSKVSLIRDPLAMVWRLATFRARLRASAARGRDQA